MWAEMTFTDDDLKRLKQDLIDGEGSVVPWHHKIGSLLARLEAAEFLINLEHICEELHSSPCPISLAQEAWRKASGR